MRLPQALVVVPTRELAIQNASIIQRMGKFTKVTVLCSSDTDRVHSAGTTISSMVPIPSFCELCLIAGGRKHNGDFEELDQSRLVHSSSIEGSGLR